MLACAASLVSMKLIGARLVVVLSANVTAYGPATLLAIAVVLNTPLKLLAPAGVARFAEAPLPGGVNAIDSPMTAPPSASCTRPTKGLANEFVIRANWLLPDTSTICVGVLSPQAALPIGLAGSGSATYAPAALLPPTVALLPPYQLEPIAMDCARLWLTSLLTVIALSNTLIPENGSVIAASVLNPFV